MTLQQASSMQLGNLHGEKRLEKKKTLHAGADELVVAVKVVKAIGAKWFSYLTLLNKQLRKQEEC
jgi:hypothetical protein